MVEIAKKSAEVTRQKFIMHIIIKPLAKIFFGQEERDGKKR